MPLTTTCIGAYPKPDHVPIRDWFTVAHKSPDYNASVLGGWTSAQEVRDSLDRATAEVVSDQIACGIDIPTDGEVRRDNYVHYQCRHFTGFDFENLTAKSMRNNAYVAELPTISGKVAYSGTPVLVRDWQVAQAASDRPVKITLPGPLTIMDTTANRHYGDDRVLAFDLAAAVNAEARALADAGCTNIQIDEPVFARQPGAALDFGVEALRRTLDGLPEPVTRTVHICCGYPNQLDDRDYPKADPGAYLQIAAAIDGVAEQISIEDAHRHNPETLFGHFRRSSLVVGFVAIATSRVEAVDTIAARMQDVLQVVPRNRLIAAPDCGLGFLGRDLAMTKLNNLVAAARAA